MSRIHEQSAFLYDFTKLIQRAIELDFIVTAGELQRPIEMQEIYVRTGRSKTMKSKHIERMAGDLNFFDKNGNYIVNKELLQPLGDYWESLDAKNSWGGNWNNFKDTPHFERRAG